MEELPGQLALLRYDAAWLEHGFIDADLLQKQVAVFRTGEDSNTEHYRYAAFCHVLKSHSEMDDAQVAHYVKLAMLDADQAMARSALIGLLLWPRLTGIQFDALAEYSAFSDAAIQKIVSRRRLLDLLNHPPVTQDTFTRCLATNDAAVQRELVSHPSLTQEQLHTLAERGVNRAIRNMARVRCGK